MFTIGILTVSDRGARGERRDDSGQAIKERLACLDAQVKKYDIVPDELEVISAKLKEWSDDAKIDLIITTGGTGLSSRDVTPEATLAVLDRLAPGFTETMRAESLKKTPFAILSRAQAGTRKNTLIINLPGSPRAVRECLEVLLLTLPHAMEIIRGEVKEHAPHE